jgi:hypothetical protein
VDNKRTAGDREKDVRQATESVSESMSFDLGRKTVRNSFFIHYQK